MTSPVVARALARKLPAVDRTGDIYTHPGAYERRLESAELADMGAERLTVGPSRQSYTVADLQRRMAGDR